RSTAEEALIRLEGLIPPERTLLVTGAALAEQLRPLLGLPQENILVEPRAASTAPALFWATHEAHRRDPDAEILSLHADWTVGDSPAFRRAAALALDTARKHRVLVTVGVVPTRPETGFGYIVPGPQLDDDARHVARFSEKPNAATALDLMAEGALWNSGLFAWTAVDLLEQVERHTPEIAPHVSALDQGDPAAFFERVIPVSIDVGLLERSPRVAVVPGTFSWDDVGTWDALSRVRERDAQGNVTSGAVFMQDSHDCVVWSDGDPVVCFGVQDLVVVRANGRVLVAHRKRAADLKRLLEAMPGEIRDIE
ncbi:MAG: mannose-1-phosphate guanylyltransferase, partial [Gemmatimonadales bacterium]